MNSSPLPAASTSGATVRPSAGASPPLAALLMAVSGFAGLAYQIVWTQQFGVWLGHEIVSVLAVVAAFFGGLALGAHALSRRIGASHSPARWYAACEAVIALWAVLLNFLMQPANAWLASLTGAQPSSVWQWSVAFLGPFLLLLPATFAMGATLPAIEGVRQRLRSQGFAIGELYAANTLGAVAGVLAAAFLLIPRLGLSNTALVCAGLNLLCALAAWQFLPCGSARQSGGVAARRGVFAGGARLPLLLFATGALGIGYEVVVVRSLSQVAEDTVYTFAVLLAVYLLGTAAGAAIYQHMLAAHTAVDRVRHGLLAALCAAMLAGIVMLGYSDTVSAALAAALGPGIAPALLGEAALALAAFGLPTLVMGALFSHLCVEAKAAGWGFGSAIGINTLGAALAPLLFGVLALPWLGAQTLLCLIALAYLALIPLTHWRPSRVWLLAPAGIALLLLGPPLMFVELPEGGQLRSYRDGVMATVSVVQDADGVTSMRINNRQQEGSSASGLTDARLAYLPLLLHPQPGRALFLGLGTGVTASAAAQDRALTVDAIELLPEVIAASAYFDDPSAGARPKVIAADPRRYVRASEQRYDVIVADLFHPARSGAGALYTVEHFTAIRTRLAREGVFCQWLPLHQLDLATLRSIVASFLRVYPGASAILANNSLETPLLGLIAHPDLARLDLARLQQRMAAPQGQARRVELQLADHYALLGSFVADAASLARFAAGAPLNTDDRPTVNHRAPYATYAPEALPRQRLVTLLQNLQVQPQALFGVPANSREQNEQRRLQAYWNARTRFVELGVGVRPHADPRVMLAQVRAPLLDMLATSPEFGPAYLPLVNMAQALAASDPAEAERLLQSLLRLQPARPEAQLALTRLQSLAPRRP